MDNGEWKNGWAYPMPDGVWYWRLCSKSIFGEDDKCYLEPEIRQLTLTDAGPPPPPPPPPPACSNGEDDDGDGEADLDDSACDSEEDNNERPVLRLSERQARTMTRDILDLEFGRYVRRRSYMLLNCRRQGRAVFSCFVDWMYPRRTPRQGRIPRNLRHYWGTVRLRHGDVDTYRYFVRLKHYKDGKRQRVVKFTGTY